MIYDANQYFYNYNVTDDYAKTVMTCTEKISSEHDTHCSVAAQQTLRHS